MKNKYDEVLVLLSELLSDNNKEEVIEKLEKEINSL